MALVDNIKESFRSQLVNFGVEGLASIYSDLNASNLLTFEIINITQGRVKSFTFPIAPETISVSENNTVTVTKTSGGVSVSKNNSFKPKNISMTGTFGRTFKAVIPNELPLEFAGVSVDFNLKQKGLSNKADLSFNTEKPQFSNFAKTGFGCLQLLYEMYQLSNIEDNYLVGYFGSLGKDYIIEINSISSAENSGANNMLPTYTINATAVADYSEGDFNNAQDVLRRLTRAGVQRFASSVASSVVRSVKNIL